MKSFNLYKKSLLVLIAIELVLLPTQVASARDSDIVEDSVRDILTVASIGAAGAVLGLSTLSFVDEPKDHLRNIVVGGAIGIIIGVGVVAYNQANMSREYYERHALSPDFDTSQRVSWHQHSTGEVKSLPVVNGHNLASNEGLSLNYNFSF